MSRRTISIEHNGKTYSGRLANVAATSFGWEDHGILTAHVHCEWLGGGVSVGGFALDAPDDGEREGTAYGLDFLMTLMRVVGANSWEQLTGMSVLVLFDSKSGSTCARSVGVAHATDESKVFILQEHADEWRENETAVS